MGFGTLTLAYGAESIEVATVTSFSESFSKNCMTTPLVSLSVDDTFAIETGSSKVYNISFTRVSSQHSISNAGWIEQFTAAVNRWQCKTDGFTMHYVPDSDNPYIGERLEDGYIKSLTIRYTDESNETIKGSFEFHVGTMYVRNPNAGNASVSRSNFLIQMSSSDGSQWYPLLANVDQEDAVDCVESYTLTGGLEQPFEYLTMEIPKNRLTSVAADLVDDIVAGKNSLLVRAVGQSTMTVTKCKLRNKTYSITAYSNCERIRGYKLQRGDAGSRTPFDWIMFILTESSNYGIRFTAGTTFHYAINSNPSEETDILFFGEETNVWYILQVCAMYLGARIFFSGDSAYLVDYRSSSHFISSGNPLETYGNLNLYETSTSDNMYGRVIGNVTLGDEGVDTIINSLTVKCSNEVGVAQNSTQITEKDDSSIRTFEEREGNTLYMPNLVEVEVEREVPPPEGSPEGTEPTIETLVYAQAQVFAGNYISYRSEPQQSITFNLKEMGISGQAATWTPFFHNSSMATSIQDTVDDVLVTNGSAVDGTTKTQLLTLSQYERHYPEGYTAYTWGVMANIDLSSSTSQILSNQGVIL